MSTAEPTAAPVPDKAVVASDVDNEPFAAGAARRFRERWQEVQAGFVDDPAGAVRDAGLLMDEVLDVLAEHKRRLAEPTVDTEQLRQSLRRYRELLDRLLPA